MGSVLAIDHGERKTGFAVADPLRIAVGPLPVCTAPGHGSELLEHIAGLLAEREVAVLLVGLPLNMDGSEGPRCARVRGFMARLAARFPAQEVLAWDERLSTREADELLVEAGYTGEERKRRRDSWSALVFLRAWIEEGEPRELG